MAFDVDDKKVKTVLSNSSLAKSKVELPKKIESEENKKSYSFTLEPSVKEGLEKLAEKQNYKNTSQFLNDLIKLFDTRYIEVWGKFTPRGGISIDPWCNYGKPGTKFEEMATHRLMNHDMYPEKVDNR